VWAELDAAAGTVQGVATFDFPSDNGTLITSAEVLGIEGRSSVLLPVDVTASASTGLAIAIASGSPLAIELRLFGKDGALIATACPSPKLITPVQRTRL